MIGWKAFSESSIADVKFGMELSDIEEVAETGS